MSNGQASKRTRRSLKKGQDKVRTQKQTERDIKRTSKTSRVRTVKFDDDGKPKPGPWLILDEDGMRIKYDT